MGDALVTSATIILKDQGGGVLGSKLRTDLSWSGTLTQGSTITIDTDGTFNFGTKAQAAPVLWDMIDEVFENGTSKTHVGLANGASVSDGDVYDNVNNTVKFSTDNSRNARRSFGYFGDAATQTTFALSFPRAFDVDTIRASSNHELYTARRFNNLAPINPETVDRLYADAWIESTAYTINDLRSWKGTSPGPQTGTGSDLIYEAQNSGTSGASEPTWPDESTAVIGVTDFTDNDITWLVVGRSSSSTKFGRVWDNPDGLNTRISWTHDQFTGPFSDSGMDTELAAGWHLLEIFVSNRLGVAKTYIDGVLHHSVSDFVQTDENYGLAPTSVGFEQNGSGPNLIEIYWGEMYGDRSAKRVMFGNASTWTESTEFIYQRTTSWAASQIQVIVNDDGETLAGNWFLYVIDADNNVINESGAVL